MYLIGVIVFLGLTVGLAFLSSVPLNFVDLPSLLVILALSLPVLMASGLICDFFKGFRLMGQKVNPFSEIELKRILQANVLAIRSILLSGALGTMVGVIALLTGTSGAGILPGLGTAMLTVLYSVIFVLLVLPVQAKAKAVLAGTLQMVVGQVERIIVIYFEYIG